MGGKGSGRKYAPGPDMSEVNRLKREKALADIEKYKKDLKMTVRSGAEPAMYIKTMRFGQLTECYKTIGDTKLMCKTAQSLIDYVKSNSEKIDKLDEKQRRSVNMHFREAHIKLAPNSFHHYLVAMEWNYPPEMKFYANRYCVMRNWAMQLERLEFGELDILGLSAPPRTGKTGIGELFLSWVIGRHPDESTLFATHTNGNAVKTQTDVYNLITDERRCWSEIFPGYEIEKSAEYLWIDLSPKNKPNNYKTIYFRGIDGAFAGVLESSWLTYCDDLIKNIEEALNPVRIENAWQKYGTDISQRRVDDSVKELHIATRWSINDVVSALEEENENNPRANFIKVPGLNADGESNFMFPYRPMTKEHFEKLRTKMDDVSFECIVQQNPIERDGLIFPRDSLKYYEGILPGEPDFVCAACDVAWGGGDYLSMPIAYCYESLKLAYIHDVVHSPETKENTKPQVVSKIIEHKVTRDHFEANNGGDEYADDIIRQLKERNYRCSVTHSKAPTGRTKLDRIVSCSPEIKGAIEDGSGWKLFFLSKSARKDNPQYEMYMKHLTGFNQGAKFQGKQKDDAADGTATLITNVLGGHSRSAKLQTFSLSSLRR